LTIPQTPPEDARQINNRDQTGSRTEGREGLKSSSSAVNGSQEQELRGAKRELRPSFLFLREPCTIRHRHQQVRTTVAVAVREAEAFGAFALGGSIIGSAGHGSRFVGSSTALSGGVSGNGSEDAGTGASAVACQPGNLFNGSSGWKGSLLLPAWSNCLLYKVVSFWILMEILQNLGYFWPANAERVSTSETRTPLPAAASSWRAMALPAAGTVFM
jgi:hypothetical protein